MEHSMTPRLIARTVAVLTTTLAITIAGARDEDALAAGQILTTTTKVSGSSIPRVTIRGVVDAPPARIWAIVGDCDTYVARLPRIRASRVVERTDHGMICELTVALPFPLSDLTAKTRAVHVEGPPRWDRRWTLVKGDYEINDGSWVLEVFQGDPNRTLVTYSVHAVPHSAVPPWARRRAQESSMPGLIERLREETR